MVLWQWRSDSDTTEFCTKRVKVYLRIQPLFEAQTRRGHNRASLRNPIFDVMKIRGYPASNRAGSTDST